VSNFCRYLPFDTCIIPHQRLLCKVIPPCSVSRFPSLVTKLGLSQPHLVLLGPVIVHKHYILGLTKDLSARDRIFLNSKADLRYNTFPQFGRKGLTSMALADRDYRLNGSEESSAHRSAVEAIVLDETQYNEFRHELESGANGEGKQLREFLAKAERNV
jgi:hypothetical protein